MRNVLAIAWREIRAYFASPLAYVVCGVFVGLCGFMFWASLLRFSDLCLRYGNNPYVFQQLNVNDMVIRPIFGTMGIIFLLVIPMIAGRLLAEERRSGTAELLFTCPVTSGQVVIGKFLAAAFLLLVMLSFTLSYPALIAGGGAQADPGPTLIGYFGVLLMGLSFLGIGLLISSLTESQIIAAVGSFGVLLLLWVINWVTDSAPELVATILNKISLIEHFADFRKGVFDTQHLVFYLSVIFVSLFLTQRVLESRQWR